MDEKTLKKQAFIVNTLYVAVICALVFLAIRFVVIWVLPFIIAFTMVAVLHPLIKKIESKIKIKQEVVSIIVMILIYLGVGTLLFFLVFQAVILVKDGLTLLPEYYYGTINPTMNTMSTWFTGMLGSIPLQWQAQIQDFQVMIVDQLQSFLINLSQHGIVWLTDFTKNVPSYMIAMGFTIMLSFFISLQYDSLIDFFNTQMPDKVKRIISDTRSIIFETIYKYFRASLTLMFITACELAVGLLILGQKNAIAIAAGISVFDALPFFGTGAIVIPWIIIELIQGEFTFAIGLGIVYAIITVVRSLIEPKVVGDKLGLNPIVSLVAIYLGYRVFGVLGMIFMPIVTQILIELHRKGSIKMFKDQVKNDFKSKK